MGDAYWQFIKLRQIFDSIILNSGKDKIYSLKHASILVSKHRLPRTVVRNFYALKPTHLLKYSILFPLFILLDSFLYTYFEDNKVKATLKQRKKIFLLAPMVPNSFQDNQGLHTKKKTK